jgi:hypothetical protein
MALLGACLLVLPVWGAAVLVAYGYRLASGRVRYGREWAPRVGLAALATAGALAAWRLELGPATWLGIQASAGAAFWNGATLPDGMPADQLAASIRAWAAAVWPYALALGLPAGAALSAGDRLLRLPGFAIAGGEETRTRLRFEDATRLEDTPVAWAVPRVVGRGVVTLLSAPPGLGKGWWTWGLVRAMQDGGTFYGLPARRIGRVLWCTEEGPSFKRTAARFGIRRGMVVTLPRHRVRGWDWPSLLTEIRRQAWRRGCAVVVVDTIRAWCPEAEQSNAQAAEVMNLARDELAAHGLAVIFVHHDTKAGGEHGEQVAGPNNLVGSCDVLVALQRVKSDETARRMVTSRRYGEMDITARLDGHRYLVDGGEDRSGKGEEGEGQDPRLAARAAVREAMREGTLPRPDTLPCAGCGGTALEYHHHRGYSRQHWLSVTPLCKPCHTRVHPVEAPAAGAAKVPRGRLTATQRETVATIHKAGGEMRTPDFIAALGITKGTASKRLTEAEAAGLLERSGKGGSLGPQRWRVR